MSPIVPSATATAPSGAFSVPTFGALVRDVRRVLIAGPATLREIMRSTGFRHSMRRVDSLLEVFIYDRRIARIDGRYVTTAAFFNVNPPPHKVPAQTAVRALPERWRDMSLEEREAHDAETPRIMRSLNLILGMSRVGA